MIRKTETARDYSGIKEVIIKHQIKEDAAALLEVLTEKGIRLDRMSKKDAAFIAASLNNILKIIGE